MLYLVLSRYWYHTFIQTYSATSPLKSTLGNGQNFFAKLLSKSTNLYGSGSGRIFALSLPLPCPKPVFSDQIWSIRPDLSWDYFWFKIFVTRFNKVTFIDSVSKISFPNQSSHLSNIAVVFKFRFQGHLSIVGCSVTFQQHRVPSPPSKLLILVKIHEDSVPASLD